MSAAGRRGRVRNLGGHLTCQEDLGDSAAVTGPDRHCWKRVCGIGSVSASEEKIPPAPGASLQQRSSNCGRPELDSVRHHIISTKIDFFNSIDPKKTKTSREFAPH